MFFIIRKKTRFVYYAIFSLFVFSSGILSAGLWRFLEYPWKRLDINNINSAYGIVVLSGGGRTIPLGQTKVIEWEDPDRFLAGVDLYKSGKGNKLIFTGGTNPYSSGLLLEGDIYLKEAILQGIPIKDLLTTPPVFNTFQEAKAIKKLLIKESSLKPKNIILVTSAFHMKRAKTIFEKEGIIVYPFPVDFKSSKSFELMFSNPTFWIPSAENLNKTSLAIREIIGRIIYRFVR